MLFIPELLTLETTVNLTNLKPTSDCRPLNYYRLVKKKNCSNYIWRATVICKSTAISAAPKLQKPPSFSSPWGWMGARRAPPASDVTRTNGNAPCAVEGRHVIISSRPECRAALLGLQSLRHVLCLCVCKPALEYSIRLEKFTEKLAHRFNGKSEGQVGLLKRRAF